MPTVDDNDSNEYDDVTDNCDNDCEHSIPSLSFHDEDEHCSIDDNDKNGNEEMDLSFYDFEVIHRSEANKSGGAKEVAGSMMAWGALAAVLASSPSSSTENIWANDESSDAATTLANDDAIFPDSSTDAAEMSTARTVERKNGKILRMSAIDRLDSYADELGQSLDSLVGDMMIVEQNEKEVGARRRFGDSSIDVSGDIARLNMYAEELGRSLDRIIDGIVKDENESDISQRAMVTKEEPSLSSSTVGRIELYVSELERGLDCVIHGICSSGMDVLL